MAGDNRQQLGAGSRTWRRICSFAPIGMIHIAIALSLSVLTAPVQSTQGNATFSVSPPSTQSVQTEGQESISNPSAEGSTPSTVLKVCGPNSPPPCATPPQVVKSPPPNYSKEARKKKIEGTAVLWLIVGADGLPRNIRVARSLGYGLDEEAIKAVQKWRFRPSTVDGHPVAVQINVEVSFRLE